MLGTLMVGVTAYAVTAMQTAIRTTIITAKNFLIMFPSPYS